MKRKSTTRYINPALVDGGSTILNSFCDLLCTHLTQLLLQKIHGNMKFPYVCSEMVASFNTLLRLDNFQWDTWCLPKKKQVVYD
jgi:hypothetical protein